MHDKSCDDNCHSSTALDSYTNVIKTINLETIQYDNNDICRSDQHLDIYIIYTYSIDQHTVTLDILCFML